MPSPSSTASTIASWAGRVPKALGLPVDAAAAGLLFLAAIHTAVTSFRVDRGWSQQIPSFAVAALVGLAGATAVALWRRRPLADARAFVAIAASALVLAFFGGKAASVASVEDIGLPPSFHTIYLAATALFAAAMAWIVPARPVEGFLLASLVFATPATRVLLRWAPDGFEVAPICIALAALVHSRTTSAEPFRSPPLAKPAIAFAAITVLSAAFGTSYQTGIPAAARTVLQVCAFLVAAESLGRERRGRWCLGAAAAVAALVSSAELWAFVDFGHLVGWPNAKLSRLESFKIHPNLVAPYSATGAVLCAGAFFCARSLAARGGAALGYLVCAGSVYLHHSGGATWGLLAGTALVLVGVFASRGRRAPGLLAEVPGAVIAAMPILVFIGALAAPLVVPRLEGGGEAGKINIGTRIEFWRASRRAMLHNPIFGLGPRNVEARAEYVDEAIEANIDWSNHPHNIVVEVGETLGFTGLAAFIILCILAGGRVRAALRGDGGADPRLAVAGAAVLTAILTDGAFDHGFAEFAVLTDSFWLGLLLVAAASSWEQAPALAADGSAAMDGSAAADSSAAPDAAEGAATSPRRMAILGIATTLALVFGGVVPLICSGLEQSSKWLQYWSANANRYETFRDAEGRRSRLALAVAIAPYRADLRLTYADTLLGIGRVDEAVANVDRAVDSAPHTSETLQRAATFYLNLGNPPSRDFVDKALKIYQRTTRLGNPEERALAHLGLARCYGVLGRMENALDELATALSMWPQLPITVFGFRRVPPTATDPDPDVTYRIAGPAPLSVTLAVRRALERLRPQLETNFGTTWGPVSRLGECLVSIGRPDLAIAEFLQIEAKAPDKRMNLPSILGQARMSARRYDEAIADFDRAIANGGWHPTMSGLKARALEASNRNSEALAESKRFLDGAFDAFSFRSMAKDAFKRVAYMESNLSQYDAAAANFQMAAAYEDNKPERIRLLMDAATAATRGCIATPARSDEFLDLLCNCFGEAASATGTLDWGEYDHNKLVELGVQVGRAAPNRAALLFDRLIDTIRDSPSAGAYSLVYGVGKVVVEQLQNAQKFDEADKQQGRLSEMQRVLTALAPRGMFKT